MMAHTKGPWKATRNASFSYSIGTDYAHDRGHDCNIVREVRCEANALLIAASPELLRSAKQVFTAFFEEYERQDEFPDNPTTRALVELHAAIEKAEGRA